ncbi:putative DNA-binding transcriptional regulator, partial [Escherichia coli ONT:H33 str. C48/93]
YQPDQPGTGGYQCRRKPLCSRARGTLLPSLSRRRTERESDANWLWAIKPRTTGAGNWLFVC